MTRGRRGAGGRALALLVASALAGSGVAACAGDGDGDEGEGTTPTATPSTTPRTATTASSVGPATSTTTDAGPPPPIPTGLVWARDFPDPFVVTLGGATHVGYATSVGVLQLQEGWSGDLAQWVGPQEALAELPAWAVPYSSWAPALSEVDGSYLLYYTAMVAGTDRHCISVAEAPSPRGPFVDRSDEPLLCPMELGGAIDPSPFVDAAGDRYLLWKSDGVTLRRESAIWSQPLSEDGRRLAGPAVRLIGTDQAWEYPHVEAPSMAVVDGTYWLAYSGNWWNADAYGVGVARCESPGGPCEKPYGGPVLASEPGRYGPGGAELFRDRWGRLLLAYHAWPEPPGFPGGRALFIAPVRADAEDLAVEAG